MGRLNDTTDWDAVDALTDEDIAASVVNDPDAAPLHAEGLRPVKRGRPRQAVTKEQVTIRLSPDVLAAFRQGGRGWQTRIDSVLRDWVSGHRG